MEHIISFGETFSEQDNPFYIEMAGITYPDSNYHITRKRSYIQCFEYVIRGEGIIQVDNHILHPVEGDLYILPKDSYHNYYSLPENPWEKIWMNVSGNLCEELIHVYGLTGVYLVKQIDVYPLFREFLDICENKMLTLEQVYQNCSLVFHKLILKIAEHLSATNRNPSTDTALEIKSYIDRFIYERLSIDVIAQKVCLSPSQVNRVFKQNFHMTPYEYILNRKILTAKLLLKNTSLSVKEIAYKLKFADEHYFSNIFLKKTGCRPKNYCNALKEIENP